MFKTVARLINVLLHLCEQNDDRLTVMMTMMMFMLDNTTVSLYVTETHKLSANRRRTQR